MKKQQFDLVLGDQSTETRTVLKSSKSVLALNATWQYLGVVGDIGFTIAIPIVLGGLLGTYIDTNFGTKPKGVLLFLFLGIILSIVGFISRIKDIIEMQSTKK